MLLLVYFTVYGCHTHHGPILFVSEVIGHSLLELELEQDYYS